MAELCCRVSRLSHRRDPERLEYHYTHGGWISLCADNERFLCHCIIVVSPDTLKRVLVQTRLEFAGQIGTYREPERDHRPTFPFTDALSPSMTHCAVPSMKPSLRHGYPGP